jgi:hypothetical protein
MPQTFKRLYLRAVPKAALPREMPLLDEFESATGFDAGSLIVVLRGNKSPTEETMRDIVRMAHSETGRGVIGIFLDKDMDLEVYEVEEAPDPPNQLEFGEDS